MATRSDETPALRPHGRAAGVDHRPALHPSASFSATMRVRLENQPGAFAALAAAIGEAGGLLGSIDLVRVGRGHKVRDVTFLAADTAHVERILDTVRHVRGVEIEHVSDRTFLAHLGGKLEVTPRTPLKTRDDLSIATGRSDYPNQINNVLVFPGVFRGALDVRAREITAEMEVAAARALAGVVKPGELGADYIVPSVFTARWRRPLRRRSPRRPSDQVSPGGRAASRSSNRRTAGEESVFSRPGPCGRR